MDVSWRRLVEASSPLLKKPLFKNKQTFFEEVFLKYSDRDLRDDEGNNFAHLSILNGRFDFLDKCKHLMDHKNKRGLTPKDLLRLLTTTSPHEGSLCIYKTQEKCFETWNSNNFKEEFQTHFLPHLVFKRVEDLLWVIKKCDKKLDKEPLRKRNQWIDSLYGNAFLAQKGAKTYIKWVSSLVGYGLFAKEDIPQYSFIGEYTGIVRKRDKKLDYYNDYIFGYVAGGDATPYVIDALEHGNHTRFLNHSDEPNLYSTWIIHKGVCHIILVSKSFIKKDTQLTYDYGPTYWKKRTDPLDL